MQTSPLSIPEHLHHPGKVAPCVRQSPPPPSPRLMFPLSPCMSQTVWPFMASYPQPVGLAEWAVLSPTSGSPCHEQGCWWLAGAGFCEGDTCRCVLLTGAHEGRVGCVSGPQCLQCGQRGVAQHAPAAAPRRHRGEPGRRGGRAGWAWAHHPHVLASPRWHSQRTVKTTREQAGIVGARGLPCGAIEQRQAPEGGGGCGRDRAPQAEEPPVQAGTRVAI